MKLHVIDLYPSALPAASIVTGTDRPLRSMGGRGLLFCYVNVVKARPASVENSVITFEVYSTYVPAHKPSIDLQLR